MNNSASFSLRLLHRHLNLAVWYSMTEQRRDTAY